MFAIHAPAKVNLYLHVGPPGSDGRHPLDSLVVFADARAADRIVFAPSSEPSLTFQISNGSNEALEPDESNLVLRAVRALEAASGMRVSGTLTLEKHLPIAAGMGEGSADAAAILLMLNAGLSLRFDRKQLMEIAIPLGGDVPACVAGEPVLMRGDGDRVEPLKAPHPVLPALIFWPGLACPTGPVFRKYDAMGPSADFAETAPPEFLDPMTYAAQLSAYYQNDLEAPACALIPEISDVLSALQATEGQSMTALSGSGATCFAIYDTEMSARSAAFEMERRFPAGRAFITQLGAAGFDPEGFSL